MTVVINEKKFDRFWTITAGFLCLLALVLTLIALRTSSWTINEYSPDGEVQWYGLFYTCNRHSCSLNYNHNFPVIFISILGVVFLLISTLSVFLMGVHSFPREHFYLTPSLSFIAVLLLFIGLVVYAGRSVINGVSARLYITALVLSYTSFAIVVFIAGRYSIFYQRNPMDFTYRKAETDEPEKKVDEPEVNQQ